MKNDKVAFSYLINIQNKFLSSYTLTKAHQSFSYQLKDFSVEIKAMNNLYEKNQHHTQPEMLEIKDNKQYEIIKENASNLFNKKADKIELIVKPSPKSTASNENISSKKTKLSKYLKYAKLILIFITLTCLIIWSIITLF